MPAIIWSAVHQRQPTSKRVSQWPAKPVKLVFLGVSRNVARGMVLSQFLWFCGYLNDQKHLLYIALTVIYVTCFYASFLFLGNHPEVAIFTKYYFLLTKMPFMKIRRKNYLQIFRNKMVFWEINSSWQVWGGVSQSRPRLFREHQRHAQRVVSLLSSKKSTRLQYV